jgi:hypothetical protein
VQPTKGGTSVTSMNVDAFIDLFKADVIKHRMNELGFHETIASRRIVTFGNIAHAFVVFEARLGPDDGSPPHRGVDSIQLIRKGDRWWVASITTQFERPGRPIPEELLGSADG